MDYSEKKINDLFQSARKRRLEISLDETLKNLGASIQKKSDYSSHNGSVVKRLFLLAIAVIIASTFYFMNLQTEHGIPSEPIKTNRSAQPAGLPEIEKDAAIENIKNNKKTENAGLTSMEEIIITEGGKKYTLYFKNDILKELTINNAVTDKSQWKNHQGIIEKAQLTKKQHEVANTSINTKRKSFEEYVVEQLQSRGVLDGNVKSIKFSKDYIMLDRIKLDDSVFHEITETYKSGIK